MIFRRRRKDDEIPADEAEDTTGSADSAEDLPEDDETASAAGDDEAAGAQLRTMYDRFPDNEEVRTALIGWYLGQGDTEGAEAFLRELAGADTGPVEGHAAVVQLIAGAEGPEAAALELDRLIAARAIVLEGLPGEPLHGHVAAAGVPLGFVPASRPEAGAGAGAIADAADGVSRAAVVSAAAGAATPASGRARRVQTGPRPISSMTCCFHWARSLIAAPSSRWRRSRG